MRVSTSIRWPSCHAAWFAPGQGRTSMSASLKSASVRVNISKFRDSPAASASFICMLIPFLDRQSEGVGLSDQHEAFARYPDEEAGRAADVLVRDEPAAKSEGGRKSPAPHRRRRPRVTQTPAKASIVADGSGVGARRNAWTSPAEFRPQPTIWPA